jgi:hypothetical protein
MSRHYVDFAANTELVDMTKSFITLMANTGMTNPAEQLDKMLAKMVGADVCDILY